VSGRFSQVRPTCGRVHEVLVVGVRRFLEGDWGVSMSGDGMGRAAEIAGAVETFVRDVIIPYERDPRWGSHGASDELVREMRDKARTAGVLTPHILPGGHHLTQRETALVLKKSGLSPLGPLAVNTAAPDEGNMYLLGKI